MYYLVRLIIVCIVFIFVTLIIKRYTQVSKRKKIYTIIGIIPILGTVLTLFPVENTFITFNSPEAAFRYSHFGYYDIRLVVEGEKSDLVVAGDNKDVFTHSIIPKTQKGWKIGIGVNKKTYILVVNSDISVYTDYYKDTNEHYIFIYDFTGCVTQIDDVYGSNFAYLEYKNDGTGESIFRYYAYIPDYNQNYWLEINGKKVLPVEG